MSNVNALVPSVDIDTVIMRRNAMVDRLKAAQQQLIEANELSEAMFGAAHQGYALALCTYRTRRDITSDDGIADLIKGVDARIWSYLLSESGLGTFMDATARAEWDKAIDRFDVPEVTRETIENTFTNLYAQRKEMFERGVIQVFKELSWEYKTNLPVMFGKKVILKYMIDRIGLINHRGADKLDDLTRVFSLLDGNKPEPDYRQRVYARLSSARHESRDVVEFEYFTMTVFKNGNGHLVFKRSDLVDKMNEIIARHFPDRLGRAA